MRIPLLSSAGIGHEPTKLIRRPRMAAMIALAICCTCIQGMADGDGGVIPLTIFSVYIGLLIGMYWNPFLCGTAIVSLSIALGCVPDADFPMQFWNVWLAFGLLGYGRHLLAAAMTILVQAAAMTGMWHLHGTSGWSLSGIGTFNASCIIMIVVGYAIAEHRSADILRQKALETANAKRERDLLRRDIELASRIHDSTTRGLALITILANQCMDCPPDERQANLALIQSTAQSTLADVRKVIDALETDRGAKSAHDDAPLTVTDMVHGIMKSNDVELRSIGIYGHSAVQSETAPDMRTVPSDIIQEISDFLNQLYSNIAVYGTQGDDAYYMHVEIENSVLCVEQFNIIGNESRMWPHRGRGLSLHAKRIHALGGSLETRREEENWIVRARIPLYHTTNCRTMRTMADKGWVDRP